MDKRTNPLSKGDSAITKNDDQMKADGTESNEALERPGDDDEELEYVPDEEENSFDDEGTLDEEEALENDTDIADEIAALQEDQDIPVEDLVRLYDYNNSVGQVPSSSIVIGEDENEIHSINASGSAMIISSSIHFDAVSGNSAQQLDEAGVIADSDDADQQNHEHGYFSTSDEDSENDFDYIPEESWRKEIKLGPEHQAEVPEATVSSLDEVDSSDELDQCMWQLDEKRMMEPSVEIYLKSAYQNQREILLNLKKQLDGDEKDASEIDQSWVGPKRKFDSTSSEKDIPLRDDELALKVLMESNYNVEAALLAWKQAVLERKQQERSWSDDEQNAFEEGLKTHGKNFRLIQQEYLPGRTISELIWYYYMWKRTERHDVFVETYRFEKRHCGLHPNATDYMDHFLNHMALVGASSSVSPSAASFEIGENQFQFVAYHQARHQHPYLSLLTTNNHSRHHYSNQSQKSRDGDGSANDELNNANNDTAAEGKHSST